MPFQYSAVRLSDLGYGPRLISVTPPGCVISLASTIRPKDRGKCPGYLALDGWTGASVNDERRRCPDYQTAKLWDEDWRANVGLVLGDGYAAIDNDQGGEFSRILIALLGDNALRRYVLDPKHERDSFYFRVVDFAGDPAPISNIEMKFRKGTSLVRVQILARGKQSVIAGVHPETKAPYVWERELPPIEEFPKISLEQFREILSGLVEQARAQGWLLEGAHPAPQPVSAVSAVSAPKPTAIAMGDPTADEARLIDAEALLSSIPNRDTLPGEPRTPLDEWLDDYFNWVSVSYMLTAFLGPRLAKTPGAQAVWQGWSDGRAQTGQNSLSVWRSAVNAIPRFGEIALLDFVRQYQPARPDFPDDEEFPPDPPKKGKGTPIWDEMSRRWAYSKSKGFVDMFTGRVYERTKFADGEAYRARALCKELGIKIKFKVPSVADVFLAQLDRIEVFDVIYAPGDPPLVTSLDRAMPSFNRWKATTALAASVNPSQIQTWLDHLEFVLGSVAERDRFLRWCAFVVQNPKLKPNWHFLILSEPGFGKDAMLLPITMAVGEGNFIDMLSYALANDFNPWAEHKLIVIGEMAQSKSGASEVNTRLKPLLAQPPPTLTINQKNMRQYEIPNRCAVIMFSNEKNPLPLERKSRRIHVVNRREASPRSTAYYKGVYDWLTGGGATLCASFLLAYPLSDAERGEFIGGVAPVTADKEELEEQNVHPQQGALEDLITDARAGITADTPHTLVATAQELAGFIKLHGFHHVVTARSLGGWLLDMERRGEGVHRVKLDPNSPSAAGVVSAQINGQKHQGRLWALADATVDGRKWSALTEAEIVAIWKNLTPPKSATILHHPAAKAGGDFPDEPV